MGTLDLQLKYSKFELVTDVPSGTDPNPTGSVLTWVGNVVTQL
jgi:hypothetical protein